MKCILPYVSIQMQLIPFEQSKLVLCVFDTRWLKNCCARRFFPELEVMVGFFAFTSTSSESELEVEWNTEKLSKEERQTDRQTCREWGKFTKVCVTTTQPYKKAAETKVKRKFPIQLKLALYKSRKTVEWTIYTNIHICNQ